MKPEFFCCDCYVDSQKCNNKASFEHLDDGILLCNECMAEAIRGGFESKKLAVGPKYGKEFQKKIMEDLRQSKFLN